MNVLINIRDRSINDAHLTWVSFMSIQTFFAPAMRALGPKAKVRVIYIDMHGYEECLYHQQ